MPLYRVTAVQRRYVIWTVEASSAWEAIHVAHDSDDNPPPLFLQGETEGWEVEELKEFPCAV